MSTYGGYGTAMPTYGAASYGTAARLIAAAAGLGVDEVGEPWRRELEP